MKKLTFIALAILFFAACNSNQPVQYASSSPEIDAFKSSIKHYLAQNWDEYRQLYSDTAKFRNNVPKGNFLVNCSAMSSFTWSSPSGYFS